MLEAIIFGGSGGNNYLPNSGPGNKKLLAGSRQEGWLGKIDLTLMPTLAQIGAEFNITISPYAGTTTAAPMWLKAVIGDKVIFHPNGPWTADINYGDLYRQGLVFGVDGNSPDGTLPPNVTGANQLKYFDWIDPEGKAWLFKVRFITGNSTTSVVSTSSINADSAQQGEFYRLWWRIMSSSSASKGERWDSLVSGTDYQWVRYFDQTYIPTSQVHTVGESQVLPNLGQWWQNNGSNKFPWMPVLEVVSADGTFIYPIGVTFTTPKAKPINSAAVSSQTLIAPNSLMLSTYSVTPTNSAATSSALIAPSALTMIGTKVVPARPTFN